MPPSSSEQLRRYAREQGHHLIAYSPLAKGAVTGERALVDIAREHDATPAQVALAWLVSKQGVAPIPCSTTATHISENYGADPLELTGLDCASRRLDPDSDCRVTARG